MYIEYCLSRVLEWFGDLFMEIKLPWYQLVVSWFKDLKFLIDLENQYKLLITKFMYKFCYKTMSDELNISLVKRV